MTKVGYFIENWRPVVGLTLVAVLLVVAYVQLTGQIPKDLETKTCLAWAQRPENYNAVMSIAMSFRTATNTTKLLYWQPEGMEQEQP